MANALLIRRLSLDLGQIFANTECVSHLELCRSETHKGMCLAEYDTVFLGQRHFEFYKKRGSLGFLLLTIMK